MYMQGSVRHQEGTNLRKSREEALKQIFRKKPALIAAAVLLTAASVFSFVRKTAPAYAASSKSAVASSVAGIHNVFPESYWAGLDALITRHPNWKFVAFYTTLSFDRCLYETDAEMYPTRNLVYYKPDVSGLTYPITTSWYSTEIPGSFIWEGNYWHALESGKFYQASEEAVRYCMDPRNFFDDVQIFQFLDSSVPVADSSLSQGLVNNIVNKVGEGVPHWLKSGEELDLYYEEEVANPAYQEYLERQAALQSSIEESIAESIAASIAASETEASSCEGNPSESPEEPSSSEAPPESSSEAETDPVPPETIIVKHYLTYAEAIQRVADELGLNAAVIATRIMQEHGGGTSPLISGTQAFTVVKNGQTVTVNGGYYNYFNIGASGSSPEEILTNGLREAYANGWNTRYKALLGGAQKYMNEYISRGQTTYYLQKFNVIVPPAGQQSRLFWGQYMQNLTAPQTECRMLYNSLAGADVLGGEYTFLIPVYENMSASNPRPTKDGNPNYKLGGIYVNGTKLDGFDMDRFSYGTAFIDRASSSLQIVSYAPTTKVTASIEHDGIVMPIVWQKTTFTESGQEFGSHSAEVYFEVGKTTVTVTSTAENGDSAQYSFSVFREEKVTPSESEEPSGSDETEEPSGTPDPSGTEEPSGSEEPGGTDPTEESSSTSGPEPSTEPQPTLLYGDVNGDGVWNIKDITLIGAYILKDIQLTGNSLLRADVNGDGKVNILDITIIGAYILKDIPTVPQR